MRRHGFRFLDLPSGEEAQMGMAINMVPLAPGVVVLPAGNPVTKATLRGERRRVPRGRDQRVDEGRRRGPLHDRRHPPRPGISEGGWDGSWRLHQCTFCISNWNEETTREFPDGSKLTHAQVSQAYDGDMSGTSTVEYLMTYLPTGSVKFIGFEVLSGSIGGRSGTAVMQHDGVFAPTWPAARGASSRAPARVS